MDQANDAAAAFQYGISVAPEDDILYVNLAKVYARTGDRSKAQAVLMRLLDLKPGHAAARRAMEELSKP
jgi:Flp pilus assembly protein TadD